MQIIAKEKKESIKRDKSLNFGSHTFNYFANSFVEDWRLMIKRKKIQENKKKGLESKRKREKEEKEREKKEKKRRIKKEKRRRKNK